MSRRQCLNSSKGRWIIDGFPNTKDDWNAMTEAELFPDDLIRVQT